ncbi:hypothetical protein DF19_01000 [Streptomyces olindensis]|nr:hypothetical protein DF19_01000 [Streptomyces olindensis]
MISPDNIPTFTGDLVALQQHISSLRRAAKAIRDNGGEVHTRFQRLAPSYTAPEAEQLLATTQPVESRSSSFADDLETVAAALTAHVIEVAEIVKRLETLRGQATVFVESVKGDDGLLRSWQQDQDKVDEHQAIWDGVNAAVAAFQQAEVDCADKITALVGGTQWHINDGSPEQDNPYGFSAEQLGEADKLPWGTPAHHEALPFGIDYHLREAGVSLWNNAAGSVEGFIDLFSPGEDGDATREGLVRAIVGMESYLLDPHGDREGTGPWNMPFARESRPFAKEFAKGLVGWDDWQTNPGKAFGTVLFNGLTLGAGPLGAAAKGASAAGKAGAGARVAGTLAKVGEVLDPIGAAARTAGVAARALPRVADLTAGVRAVTEAAAAADSTHSVLRLADGSELRIADGEFIPGKGGVVDNTRARHEPPATERTSSGDLPRQHELIGVGARAPEATAHTGDSLPPGASHDVPGGSGPRDAASTHTSHATESGEQGNHTGRTETHSRSGADNWTSVPDHSEPGDIPPDGHGSGGVRHPEDNHGGQATETTPGPLELGGEAEHRLREGIRGIPRNTMKPKVLERIVSRLGEDPSGREIAEIISSGHLSQSQGFLDTVSMVGSSNPHQVPRAIDQIRLGDQLYRSGLRNIEFEVKDAALKADLDVRVTDDSGQSYGYQLKRLDNPKEPINEIAKSHHLGQLSKSEADHKIMLVDGQGTVAEWQAKGVPEELLQVHHGEHPVKSKKGRGILFVIRLEDGTLVIPPGAKVDPRGVL